MTTHNSRIGANRYEDAKETLLEAADVSISHTEWQLTCSIKEWWNDCH